MRGVRLVIARKYDKYLWRILKNIDIGKYYWHISQVEILFFDKAIGKVSSDFFVDDIMTGDEYLKYIKADDYYVRSINAQAYISNMPKQKILTYFDFLNSDCQLILLCIDSTYVDIYLKDANLGKLIFDTCISEGFSNVDYISDEYDERTRLTL